jgi:hypothetical protein
MLCNDRRDVLLPGALVGAVGILPGRLLAVIADGTLGRGLGGPPAGWKGREIEQGGFRDK